MPFKVIKNRDVLWNLQTPDGKTFGEVTYDAYEAAQYGKLETYIPKNDSEREAIESYRKHPGFSLITNTGVNLGQVTYDGMKSLENNTIDSYTPKKGESETFKKYNDYLNLQAVNIPLDDGSSLSMTYGTMKKIDDYFEKNKSNASARDTISNLIDSLGLQDVDRQDALTYAEIKAKELPEKPKKKDNFFQWAGKNAMAGVTNWSKSVWSGLDRLLPTEKVFGKYDPFSYGNKVVTEEQTYWNAAADKSSESLGGGWKFAGQVLRGATEAAPDMVLAYFTAGGSLATKGTKAVSSLKAASSMGNAALKGSTLKSTATAVAKDLASNPTYWSSFIQTVGVEYEDAIANGANEWEATASSMLSSLINAGVETGGMQKLPEAVKKGGKQVVLDWVKSSLEEGQEEVVQGIITQSVAKLIYDKNKEIASFTDQDAIINPGRMAEEFVMGASVGGVLGGITIAGNNVANRYNISQIGKESREFSDTLITIGLKNPIDSESYKNAEKLSKKDKLSDYDIGKQYILNAEQMQKNKELADVDLEESEISTGTDADTSTDAVGKVATPKERNIFTGELDEISSTEMPEVKVGDGFIEKKTSNRFEIVERDDTTTTIKITTPKNKVTIGTMPNNGADTLLVDDQFTQVESTVNTSATVDTTTEVQNIADEQSITNVFNTITSGKVTSNNIDSIIKNPQLKSAFEQLSGVKVSGTTAEQRALIKNWLNNSSNVESLKLKNAGLTTAHAKVNSLLENPVSANVRSIIRNEALTKAFESLTGVTLSGDMDTRRAIVRENAELARTNFAKAMSVSGVNVNNLTRTVGNTAKVTTETAKAKETTGTETVSNTEVDESDAQVTAVVDAINETIVPGDKEKLIAALAKGGRRADTITIAKTLRKSYKHTGTLGKMANFFTDKGAKVISAIEGTMDTKPTKKVDTSTQKTASEKQTETTSQETKASESVEKNTETKTPETDTSKTIAEKIRNVEKKIRTKVQQANDTIEQINGIQTLKQQLSDKTITPRQYENEIRKDSRYRELDDEIIALEKELDSLKNELESSKKVTSADELDNDLDNDSEDRASLSSMGSAFFGNEKVTAEEFQEMLEDGSYKDHQGYKDYVKSIVNVYTQSRGITKLSESNKAEIEKQIEGIIRVGIAAKKAGYDIFDDGNVRDIKDSKKRLLFSSLEPNSDYITSSDISTICDKRKNFAEIYDAIVKLEESRGVPADKRFFSNVDNYFILHKLMADKGLTIPCEECCVESMRKNLAPMANAFLELVTETDSKNKTNAQLYHQDGKDKGNVKKNNAKLRASVRGMYDSVTGSEIVKNHSPISVDNITIEMLTTADGLAQLKLQAPYLYEAFNSFYGQSKPKMPKQATPFRPGELIALMTDSKGKIKKGLVDKIVSTGGFRLQSYSDFQIENFTDVLQTIFEASMLGLNGHAYTKVPAFLEATKGTNLKRNISIFMYEDNGQWVLDKKNSFPMELNDIYALVASDESGNTSIIAVSQNEDMSAWIMANDNVGYGIPFHKSGLKMDVVRARVVKTPDGREVLGYANQKDHTAQQSEVWKKTLSEKKKVNTKVSKPIDIYKFWDFENKDNLSKKELIEKNIKRYIDECNKRNYRPKFRDYVLKNESVLDNVLRYAQELGYVSQDATIDDISFEYDEYRIPYGYYKFLGDFGMFKADGTAAPIETLSLENYDFDGAVEFFKDSEKLRTNELLQQFENGQVREQYRKMIEDGDLTIEQLSDILKKKREAVATSVVDGTYTDDETRLSSAETITEHDISVIQSIGRKSINELTDEELKKLEKFERTYQREMGKKSPLYRVRYGDWRATDNTPINISVYDTNAEIPGAEVINKDNKIGAFLGSLLKSETTTHAKGKSSENVRLKMLSNCKTLFENSILLDSYVSTPGGNKSNQTAFMHSFYGIFEIDEKRYLYKLFVEEFLNNGNIQRRGYEIKDIKIVPTSSSELDADASFSQPVNIDTIKSVADLFAFVKMYDKNFKPIVKEGNNNERRGSNSVLRNSGGEHNGSTRKQTEGFSSFEQKNKGKKRAERKRITEEIRAKGQTESEVVKGKYHFEVIKPEAYNDDMKAMIEDAKSRGIEIVFFTGSGIVKFDGKRANKINGLKVSDSKVYVQYDAIVSPQRIAKHESCHAKWETSEMQNAKDTILNSLTESDKETILASDRYSDYMDLYKSHENQMDIVWEEFVADTLSGMNEYTERFIDTVNEYWYGNETVEGYNPATYAESIDAGGKQIDTEYLKAVENGDIETAQKMVEEYAKKAGYSVKAYHGTTSKFTVFDKSKQGSKNGSVLGNAFYFSSDESMADEWGGRDKTMSVFLKLQNPINVDSAITDDMLRAYQALPGRDINELEDFYNSYMKKSYPTFEDYLKVYEENSKRVSEIDTKSVGSWIGAMNTKGNSNNNSTNLLKGFGIDGIISEHKRSRNFPDWTEYAVFDENQIKSADTIVYDDDGNIIPLSERFNSENDDTRWSLEGDDIPDIDELWDNYLEEYGAIPKGEKPVSDATETKSSASNKTPNAEVKRSVDKTTATPTKDKENEWMDTDGRNAKKQNAVQQAVDWTKEKAKHTLSRFGIETSFDSVKLPNISEVIKDIHDSFGITIKTGKITSKKTAGIYKVIPEVIRTRTTNDLPVVIHELGHHLNKKYHLENSTHLNEVDKIIDSDFLDNYSKKEKPGEKAAEFVRRYFKNPDYVAKTCPNLTQDFLNMLDKNDAKAVSRIAPKVNEYLSADVLDRYIATIVTAKTAKHLDRSDLKTNAHNTYTNWIDGFHPIKQLVDFVQESTGSVAVGHKNAHKLATNSMNAHNIANFVLLEQFRDLNGNIINGNKTFVESVKDVDLTKKRTRQNFSAYLMLKHALEVQAKDKKAFSDVIRSDSKNINEAIATLDKRHPEFKQAAENLYTYQYNVLSEFAVKSGLMTQKQADFLHAEYPCYVPFNRYIKEVKFPKGRRAIINQNSPIMKMIGSGRDILDPLESIVTKTETIIAASIKHQVADLIGQYADSVDGIGAYVERIPPDQVAKIVGITDLKDRFNEELQRIVRTSDDYFAISDLLDEVFGDVVKAYTPIVNERKGIMAVNRGDDVAYYQIHNAALLESVTELSAKQLPLAARMLSFTNALITQYNPVFAITNPIRDFTTAYSMGDIDNPLEFIQDYVKTMWHIIRKTDSYKMYKAMGGGHSSRLNAELGAIAKSIKDLQVQDKGLARRVAYAITHHPIQALTAFSDFTESIPRFMAFENAYKKTGDLQEAIYQADDITTNFKRRGSGTGARVANSVFRFNNAALQGLDKTRRTLMDADSNKRKVQVSAKWLGKAVLMALIFNFLCRKEDEEGYENLSSYVKNNFYNFPIGDGKFVSLPKERENGVLTSLIERTIDAMCGEDDAFYDFGGYLTSQLLPPMIPETLHPIDAFHDLGNSTLAGPIIDVTANKDFKGSPIESGYEEDLPINERYDGRTSWLAYIIGQSKFAVNMKLSPKKIDHLLGSFGFLQTANKALFPVDKKERDFTVGLLNKFIKDSNYSTDILNRAYDNTDKAKINWQYDNNINNAIEYEQNAVITSYISGMNKAIKALPEDKQRDGRKYLLKTLNNWNYEFTAEQSKMKDRLKKENIDNDYIFEELPSSEFSWTVDGQKYIYQMTPEEYNKYISDYLKVIDNARKHYGNDSLESYAEAKEAAKDYMSKYKKEVLKPKYLPKATKIKD